MSLACATSDPVTIQDISIALVDMIKDLPLEIHTFLAQEWAAKCATEQHKNARVE